MEKLVILKFNGNFESGFQISWEIALEGQSADRGFAGSLPPNPELGNVLTLWQKQHKSLGNSKRIKPQQIIYDGAINAYKQLAALTQNLQDIFSQWLNSPSFYLVDKHLREELNRAEAIRILICSDLPQIYQLPWCCWDLVENYPNLEVAISSFDFKRAIAKPKSRRANKVKILAILGDSQGLDLKADRDFLKSLKRGDVTFLEEPTREELYAHLWEREWDVVFFAGHSQTVARQGLLSLNQEDTLTIEQLKYGFAKAIDNGLQLAIFNSCDGLGIAEELGKLSLPQSIVMRMPIPDAIAQEFLKHFLQAYAKGSSLYLSTKMARQQLQAREKQYPCASWLPIIYQNPAVIPPSWADLSGKQPLLPLLNLNNHRQSLVLGILSSSIALVLVCLIQSWGWLEAGELKIYDRLIAYRPTLPRDERVVVVTIDDRDIKYQEQQGMALNMRGSLSDRALNQLLERLQKAGVKAIASDIIHDFPFEPELKENVAEADNFFAICRVKIDQQNLVSISPPPSLAPEQIGFSNWAVDDDGAIRRQILGMSPDNVCQSSVSLSLRLAIEYLNDVPAKYEGGILQIGSTKFPRLKASSGGYSLPEAQGYQTLLNYRRALPQTITLQEALTQSDRSLEQLARDKIVLIGVVGYNQDLHHTPYSRGKQEQRLSGVIIHAQMTSYIISAVKGEQKPLWWLCNRIEILWIFFWCGIGSLIVVLNKHSFLRIAGNVAISWGIILGCSWLLFLSGGWIIAIAPCAGLLLSAAIVSVYGK
ncbi:MAG: CHASE2 domain-containing protein [Cyanobacteria bacterium P01_G01_bin.19]